MPKQSGFFTLLAGVAAGAAAVFLSDSSNRKKTERAVEKVADAAMKAEVAYKKNPTAFKKKVAKQAKTTANKVAKKATRVAKKVVKTQAGTKRAVVKPVAKKPVRKIAKKK